MKLCFAVLLAALLNPPLPAYAGCGCDKPPPAPAVIVPHAAFPGMPVTLFDKRFRADQTWNVTFRNGATTVTIPRRIVLKRTLTDATGKTSAPQLIVAVPRLNMGPTGITVAREKTSFTVPPSEFTVIGMPVAVGEQTGTFLVKRYTTGIGADGTVYVSVGGLNNVCQAMDFRASLDNYPLRFGAGDIAISNYQGFAIESLDAKSTDHSHFHSGLSGGSDELNYFRHSFLPHCEQHWPGGKKEVEAADANWHRDGTPHTDYSTLIFAIAGHFKDGRKPQPGSTTFDLQVQAEVSVSPSVMGAAGASD